MKVVFQVIILAVVASCGLAFTLSGCIAGNNYWSLFSLLFLLIAGGLVGLFMLFEVTANTLFLLFGSVISGISGIGIMIIFYRASIDSALTFSLNIVGYCVYIACAVLFVLFNRPDSSSNSTYYF